MDILSLYFVGTEIVVLAGLLTDVSIGWERRKIPARWEGCKAVFDTRNTSATFVTRFSVMLDSCSHTA